MVTPAEHPRAPLHGITLAKILNQLVERPGWSGLFGRNASKRIATALLHAVSPGIGGLW